MWSVVKEHSCLELNRHNRQGTMVAWKHTIHHQNRLCSHMKHTADCLLIQHQSIIDSVKDGLICAWGHIINNICSLCLFSFCLHSIVIQVMRLIISCHINQPFWTTEWNGYYNLSDHFITVSIKPWVYRSVSCHESDSHSPLFLPLDSHCCSEPHSFHFLSNALHYVDCNNFVNTCKHLGYNS